MNNAVVPEQNISIEGKYLIFNLANEEYGIPILKVQEIMGMQEVTTVPKLPEFIKGVINLRGKIIPILDLRMKFAMEEKEYTERTCIIVVSIEKDNHPITMGIVVDEVSEVENITKKQIEPPPEFGNNILVEFLLGVGKIEKRVVVLLDIDRVLSKEEADTIINADT